jgi:hypothetical protein
MTGLTRLRALGAAALVALCVALALPAGVFAATPTYKKESKQAYEAQLNKGEIASATFNKPVRSLRLTLKNGKHALYTYPKKGSAALEEALAAKGVPVTQLHGKHKKKATSSKHTRRYIAIGILVVLALAVAGFLLARRRRLGRD